MTTSIAERNMEEGTDTPGLQEALQRGVAAAERGEREEANRIFRETVEVYPNSPEVWVWLGGTSADLDEAEIAFEQAHALDPDNPKATLGLRWVQLKRGTDDTLPSTEAFYPITGGPVPAPATAQISWDQTGPIEAPATRQLPAVQMPDQPGAAPASAQESQQMGEEPARWHTGGLSRTAVILLVIIIVLVLAALGYYWYFMPH